MSDKPHLRLAHSSSGKFDSELDNSTIPRQFGSMPPDPPMPPDVVLWRLDQHDRQIDGISRDLSEIKTAIGGLPTKADMRSMTITIVAGIIGTLAVLVGLFIASSANQLSAFQAGLSAIQAHIAAANLPSR